MKTILKLMTVVALLTVVSSGCVSYSAIQHTKSKIALRKAIQTNNVKAIKSLNDGSGYQNTGIEVTAWEAIKEEPLLSTGAGIADVAIVLGGAEGIKWMSDELKDEEASNNRNTSVSINNSDNTSVTISGDTSTTDTTTTDTTTTDNSDNR